MGDALSTYFEARATSKSYSNVNAGLPCGYREGMCGGAKGTNAAMALATSFTLDTGTLLGGFVCIQPQEH